MLFDFLYNLVLTYHVGLSMSDVTKINSSFLKFFFAFEYLSLPSYKSTQFTSFKKYN